MSNDDDDNASAMNEDNPDEGGVEAAAGANGASEGEDRDGSKPREAAASDNQQRHLTFRLVHGKSLTQEAFYDLTEGEILYKQEWRKSFRY
ncbi:hypothetical protein GUITHDRAFT_101686 [Guillardia theta CCMP2712]|uniref:Uncharacterized protein n=2 Tax=Guillardia theta TaxID=55529 RepID=L1JVV7_GUITC|nr:hypothetical protein GUITHDRAFT_101686 [Guillardia theta CCMP2712]EKX52517.1 hypothetical protein GUITHDRAFT_101686 [Guillardia theta CCMP2712]|eukprot:XP_005839497.1 hypothetical protein GUITHDRAFT_101686 [Guillardia theta CCMP2712]